MLLVDDEALRVGRILADEQEPVVGRDFWGRGLATTALAELAAEIPERPIHAWVVATNVGSIRVLEKCGFVEVERRAEHDQHADRAIEEILYRLD